MSGVSRRSVLGYSGSAAAGAVLASAGTAQAQDGKAAKTAETAETAEKAQAAAVEFTPGTEFSGRVQHATGYAELTMTFKVKTEESPAQYDISPAEIAEALNEVAAKRGWPRITFYGTPPKAPLN
ncbi:hypothetical protein [Streptomyces sp. NRRL B-1347]|uniref:hypothetical protein n=1 Tax=Streptomyces sp. NRRL B-1347 TaxID=1476877 RepID=UPI0004C9C81D|nr:hypothetical protein [Streptomyces sp. NRRL B-1347]